MAESKRLYPATGGVTVRFYRIGHGDCFLLAFATVKPKQPTYVLIDCGYKPGSPDKIDPPTDPAEVVANIREATGGRIHIAIVSHEHEDHLNAITKDHFEGIKVDQTWLAWTEDENDDVANALRKKYRDKLYTLVAARHRLAGMAGVADVGDAVTRLDHILEGEFGFDASTEPLPSAEAMLGAMDFGRNKQSLKLIRELADGNVKTILPHDEILTLPNVKDVRVFALGPPRVPAKLADDDPKEERAYPRLAFSGSSLGNYFAAAAAGGTDASAASGLSPFAARFRVPKENLSFDPVDGPFFARHYGYFVDSKPAFNRRQYESRPKPSRNEVPDDAKWRQIEADWLLAADQLAIDVANYHNNTSLVLVFELGKGGKVLLFVADAQAGSWYSWTDGSWTDDDGDTITARDLLARTVLYKVGHHGSHNATMNGTRDDDWPNLQWMATRPEHAREFTAMITAVWAWAKTKNGWIHPLPAIKEALLEKASGRVFQTDTAFDDMEKPDGTPEADWQKFRSRARGERLFFDFEIER